MHLYTIMPLDPNHIREICDDIAEQYRTGAATMALFCMSMHPEGAGPIDKAAIYCKIYDQYRDVLAEKGLQCGILVQSSIGHGYKFNEDPPFQRKIGFDDGSLQNVICPYDRNFRRFMRSQLTELARHKPALIMIDDDFRLMYRAERGCCCPLHLAEVNRRAGTNLTREELRAHTLGSSPEDKRLTDIFIATQRESILECAREYRAGIDEVDPTLPGAYCGAGDALENGAELAEILAGKGNPKILRLNNSNYHNPMGARSFSDVLLKAAKQAAVVNGRADVLLAETDTCPHNRYSTGAYEVHAHMVASIFEGCSGAKHWITKLDTYEPESGKAYRAVLAKYRGTYETLSALTPKIAWEGCRIPVSTVPNYGLKKKDLWLLEDNGWTCCVLERLGLPMFFGPKNTGAAFLHGNQDMYFTDEELTDMLRGPVFLASDTAKHLCERGLGKLLGVDVREWTGEVPSFERTGDGKRAGMQKNALELAPLSDAVRWDSTVYHLKDGKTEVPIFPGVSVFKNELGGTAIVFCGTPKANFHYTEGFSFLCRTRKLQLIRLLSECGVLPLYYPGDEQVLMRSGLLPEGERIAEVLNLGFDPIEEIALVSAAEIRGAERLQPDGSWKSVAFERRGEETVLKTDSVTMLPVILKLKY